jgi:tetraacyldisaccharide 4'-kinase
MKTPSYWHEKPGILSLLLAPLGWCYGQITGWRMKRSGAKIAVPVICIGNFTAGGAGKTPSVIHIAKNLITFGEKPFILSRGYGGNLAGPVLVDTKRHTSAETGDEPLLLARMAPTVIARDRLAGAELAVKLGASVIIMDDGLQNARLTRDMTIAVVDAGFGIGNGFCVPAGPLRAPLQVQWPHVDLILWIGDAGAKAHAFAASYDDQKPLACGQLEPAKDVIAQLRHLPLLAFAGIGRPQKFYDTLKAAKLDVRETRSFADHHAYSLAEMDVLRATAKSAGLTLVTTEKDAIRFDDAKGDIVVLPVELHISENDLMPFIHKAMSHRRSELSSRASA